MILLNAPERVPIFYYYDKTRYRCFYFDFNTSPMCCTSFFWKPML